MKGTFRRIALTFIIISLLPVGYIIFELSSLNENEMIVREIYKNQLEAILFSVNQYSDDVISSWGNRINIELTRNRDNTQDTTVALLPMLAQMNAVDHIYFTDLQGSSRIFSQPESQSQRDRLQPVLTEILAANPDRLERLINYYKAGFKKMETLDTVIDDKHVPVIFVLDTLVEDFRIGVMMVNRAGFIQNVLGPKMQTIAQGKFLITAFDKQTNDVIYSTASVQPGNASRSLAGSKPVLGEQKTLWLLPGYYLSISLIDAGIDDLVQHRVVTSLILLSLLAIVLIFGMIFLYRNVRKEMNLSQAKSEFVSNVSHEIRTPLSLISMYAETLEMDRVPEEKKHEYYSIIAKETTRLSKIVNRILDFSKMEANRKKYKFNQVQLNELCDQIYESYFFLLRDQGFTFDYSKTESLPQISGDHDSISEAIINILDNAIKYAGEKKYIEFKTIRADKSVIIQVKDRGIGIEKAHHHAIFEQFFRAPIGDVHTTKGSGLGLTLVKKTMDAHRGKVTVRSSSGEGSTFRLIFPIDKIQNRL